MAEATPLYRLRLAVREELTDLSAGNRILVAVSGGADSLALAAALLKEVKELAIECIPVIIDHQLQSNSGEVAATASATLKKLGYERVEIRRITVTQVDGPEASARRARYEALRNLAEELDAIAIFLGHTKDDQAETVLLGLARGSGTRSLSGMAKRIDIYRRPLLSNTRSETQATCQELGIEYWSDPHNKDLEYKRVRVREKILPLLESELGPGVSDALYRSAKLLRDDADALDEWANKVFASLDSRNLDVEELAKLPRAIRSRVVRLAIHNAGAPSGSLSSEHLEPIEALITAWKGQGAVSLPGGVTVARISGRLSLS